MSLARLLGLQPGTDATHECFRLPWAGSMGHLAEYFRRLNGRNERVVADVGFYLLPYAEVLLGRGAKIVVMRRRREEVIASFERKVPRLNHWQFHDGRRWDHSPWDEQFPKYHAASRAEAIGKYWDEYDAMTEALTGRHPGHVRAMWVRQLREPAEVGALLRWLGYDSPVVPEAPVWENAGP
jgi:hypothetical protein